MNIKNYPEKLQVAASQNINERKYWLNILSGEPERTYFPYDYKFSDNRTMETTEFQFSPAETEKLNKLSKNSDTRLNMILVTGLTVLLSRYTGSSDVTVCAPIYKQEIHEDFINTLLLLRTKIDGDASFKELLLNIRNIISGGTKNYSFPVEILLDELNMPFGQEDYFAISDVVCLLDNIHDKNYIRHILDCTNISFVFSRTNTGIGATVEYNALAYKTATIEKIIFHFKTVFQKVLFESIDTPVSAIPMLSPEQKNRLLFEFNQPRGQYPQDKTLHQLFQEQVEKFPGNFSLSFEEQESEDEGTPLTSTKSTSQSRSCCGKSGGCGSAGTKSVVSGSNVRYKDLNRQANRFAHLLRSRGVLPDTAVGLLLEPSLNLVAAMLGILKAGGAYLPIDPHAPEDRLISILYDSQISILLSSNAILEGCEFLGGGEFQQQSGCDIMTMDDCEELLDGQTEENPEEVNTSSDLAYIIFTSGSTGKPKGAMIEHRNVVSLMANCKTLFDFDDEDVWTMFHSYSFDFSVWEMYGALLHGAQLVMVPRMVARDPGLYRQLVVDKGVTVLNQTPSAFYNFITEELSHDERSLQIKYVIFGGEALAPVKLEQWHERYPQTRLINMFGITETTVHVTFKTITSLEIKENVSNIGVPIPTLNTYILGKNLDLLPCTVPGELTVGGAGVTRGYLNRPQLTSEKFVTNPHLENERLYRSGDLARLSEIGEMEYIGRMDNQVQLRGFRIELGEIESKLIKHQHISDALVLARKDDGKENYLCGYIVNSQPLVVSDIREFLSQSLPDYMIPLYFVQLKSFPLTPNGKIHRRALPEPQVTSHQEYVAPVNPDQEKIAKLWATVLGMEKVGIKDDYFNIGGDSIKAVKLLGLVNDVFNSELKIVDLYENETVEKLSDRLQHMQQSQRTSGLKDAYTRMDQLKERITTQHDIPESIEDIYPMSDIERGMVFSYLAKPDEVVYHDQFIFPMKYAGFDAETFKQAFLLMVEKHSILRISFHMGIYEEDVQMVHRHVESVDPYITHRDFSGMEKNKQAETINQNIRDSRLKPFNVTTPPLWRMTTYSLGADEVIVVWEFHHAILDGWSNASFMTELNKIYLELQADSTYRPEPFKNSYKAFIADQSAEKENVENHRFWKEELAGYKRLDLSRQGSRTESPGKIEKHLMQLGTPLLDKLKLRAQARHITTRSICFAAYIYMLNMISYENDILVGLVTNNRPVCEDGDRILGCFLNSVPARIMVPAQISWQDYIHQVHHKMLNIKKYERLSMLEIANITGEKAEGGNPFFDTFFNFVDFHVYNNVDSANTSYEKGDNIGNKMHLEGYETTNTLLDLGVNTTFGIFEVVLSFHTSLFDSDTIRRMGHYFTQVLHCYLDQPESIMDKASLIPPAHREKMLLEFNRNEAAFPGEKFLHQLLEEQVAGGDQDRTAILTGYEPDNPSLSYDEFNKRANQLAHRLKKNGVKTNHIVAIMVERSMEMLLGIYAVLKAGAAYMPIVPQHPTKRITFMIKDSNCHMLLTGGKMENAAVVDCAVMDIQDPQMYTGENKNLPLHTTAHLPAYVLYTSGSTGTPKGVVVEHRSVVNIVTALQRDYPFMQDDVYLLKTSYLFDVSITELFGWFFEGGILAILSRGAERDPNLILEAIGKYKISHINFVPSMFNLFVNILNPDNIESLSTLKYLFLAGEAINPDFIVKFRELNRTVIIENIYGPTEATVYGSQYGLSQWSGTGPIPIGKPVTNARLYIVDKANQLQPPGVAGELCISGVGITRGYLNNPYLTAEKFIDNPFVDGYGKDHEYARIYKTGDLTRWMPDGNIEFFGRIDHQVKVRGFRIELGEIESVLTRQDYIKEAVVLHRGSTPAGNDGAGDEKFLCAYVVATQSLDIPALRINLGDHLPGYMVPSYFMEIDSIPLNASGKLDAKALPDPEAASSGEDYVAPRDETEGVVAEVFCSVLGVKEIGINDNFFVLGGDSIKAVQISSRLLQHNLKMEINHLFQNPTIATLTPCLTVVRNKTFQGVVEGPVKWSPISRWYYENISTDRHHWNHSLMLHRTGGFRQDLIEMVFDKITLHHDVLRLALKDRDGTPTQIIRGIDEKRYDLYIHNLTDQPQQDLEEIIRKESTAIQSGIDLQAGPLLKLGLFKTGWGDHLLIVMHHLIIDGISWRIFFEDFQSAYQQVLAGNEIALPLKTTSFNEWADKVHEYAAGKEILRQLEYWKTLHAQPVQALPIDKRIEEDLVKDSQRVEDTLSREQTRLLLKEVPSAYNTEINDILLTGLGLAVKGWTGIDKILIELEGHGREEIFKGLDISRTFGWFASIYSILIDTCQSDDLPAMIKRTKEMLRAVPDKGVGGSILKYVSPEHIRRGIFTSRPEIYFNYMGHVDADMQSDLYQLSSMPMGPAFGPRCRRIYPLYINGMVVEGVLQLSVEYNGLSYRQETIKEFIDYYKKYLLDIIDHCTGKEGTEMTASDFSSPDFDDDEVDDMFDALGDVFSS